MDHLTALDDGDDVAQRHDVLQLDAREVGDGVVEADLVTLERLQRLVGAVEQPADVLQLVLRAAGVDVDDAHLLARRDHGHLQRARHPLGRAMPGARLARGHRRVGNEVDVGPGDAAAVGGDDDGAVHLGQLGEALRAVRRVDEEAARADRQHVGTIVEDEQGTGLGPHDTIDAITQWRPGCHTAEGLAHVVVGAAMPRDHRGSLRVRSRSPGGPLAGAMIRPPPPRRAHRGRCAHAPAASRRRRALRSARWPVGTPSARLRRAVAWRG